MNGDEDRDAHVVLGGVVLVEDAAALVLAPLGKIGLAQHLHTTGDLRRQVGRQVGLVYQITVDTVPHADAVLHRLDVNIAGAVVNGPNQQVIDNRDDVLV